MPNPTKQALSKSDRYYIEQHFEEETDTEMAKAVGKPIISVRKYIRQLSEQKQLSRSNKLLDRPCKGVVSMTEGSSMAAEDNDRNIVITTAEIKQAIADGEVEKATRLQQTIINQRKAHDADLAARFHGSIHYIKQDLHD